MRQVFKFDEKAGKLVEISTERAENVSAYIHPDEIAPTEHPATGRIFTSRKKFDAETFAAGCVPVAGCDRPPPQPKGLRSITLERRDDALYNAVERSYYDLRENRIPRPEQTPAHVRELWRKIEQS